MATALMRRIRGFEDLIGDQADETAYYTSRSQTGGVIDEIPSPWSDTPPTAAVNKSDIHNSSEGDALESAVLRVMRRNSAIGSTDYNFMENTAGYFNRTISATDNFYYRLSSAWNSDLAFTEATHTGAPVERLPDHLYGWGLYQHWLLTGTAASLTEADVLTDLVQSFYNDPTVITTYSFPTVGFISRGTGRHWKLACWAYAATRSTARHTLMNQLAGIHSSAGRVSPWNIWTNLQFDPGLGTADAASAVHLGVIAEACYRTWLTTTDATVRSTMRALFLDIANFVRDYGFHPTWNVAPYRWVFNYPTPGALYYYPTMDLATDPFPGYQYTFCLLNILTWATRMTGDYSYMVKAEVAHYAVTGYAKSFPSPTMGDGRGTANGNSATTIGLYLDGRFPDPDSQSEFFQFCLGASAFTFFYDQIRLRRNIDRTPYWNLTALPAQQFASTAVTRPAQTDAIVDLPTAGQMWDTDGGLGQPPVRRTRVEPIIRSFGGLAYGGGSVLYGPAAGDHDSYLGTGVDVHDASTGVWADQWKPEVAPIGPVAGPDYGWTFTATASQTDFLLTGPAGTAVYDPTYWAVTINGVATTYTAGAPGAGQHTVLGGTSADNTIRTTARTAGDTIRVWLVGAGAPGVAQGNFNGNGLRAASGRWFAFHGYDQSKWAPLDLGWMILSSALPNTLFRTSPTASARLYTDLTGTATRPSSGRELGCLFEYDPDLGTHMYVITQGPEKGLYTLDRSGGAGTGSLTLINAGTNFPAVLNAQFYTVYVPERHQHFLYLWNTFTAYWVSFAPLTSVDTWTILPNQPTIKLDHFCFDQVARKVIGFRTSDHLGGSAVAVHALNILTDVWANVTPVAGPLPNFGVFPNAGIDGNGNSAWFDPVNGISGILNGNVGGGFIGGTNGSTLNFRLEADEEVGEAADVGPPRSGSNVLVMRRRFWRGF